MKVLAKGIVSITVVCSFLGIISLFQQISHGKDLDKLSVKLTNLLTCICLDHDVYFTIEQLVDEKISKKQVIHNRYHSFDSSILNGKSLDQVVDILNNTLNGVRLVYNNENPKVIHIIDERLLVLDNYPLNGIAKRLRYFGVLEQLPKKLSEDFPQIAKNPSPIDSLGFSDLTYTKIDVRDTMVRDILTNHFDLSNHHPILWIATTSRMYSNNVIELITHFAFTGSKKQWWENVMPKEHCNDRYDLGISFKNDK